jgi:glycosyltransferase involved in cell wall biosynthesis
MRALHFMNSPLPLDQLVSGGNGIKTAGGWITALIGQLLRDTDFDLACASFGRTENIHVSHGHRIDCYVVPGGLSVGRASDRGLRLCRDLVNEWRPDVIHIHGTEAAYGLLTARAMVKCPALTSLQGLLGPYSEFYRYFGNSSLTDIVKMHRWIEIPALRGHWITFLRMRRMAQREREIIAGNRFFMGRTAWDRAYIRALNPSAQYFHGGELLREAFWHERWDIGKVRRHRIIFTNAGGYPRKGTETLLAAVKLLQPHYPDLQLAIAGGISRRSGYGRYVRCRIEALNGAAVELGQLNAEEMLKELLSSHVFVSPSFIDNSPNAVCEAQLVGMPVISTYTGGLPSLIQDGQTGLFYSTGDAPMLAARLEDIFQDDGLAVRLGSQAHEAAVKRHDPDAIVHEIAAAYKAILRRTP